MAYILSANGRIGFVGSVVKNIMAVAERRSIDEIVDQTI